MELELQNFYPLTISTIRVPLLPPPPLPPNVWVTPNLINRSGSNSLYIFPEEIKMESKNKNFNSTISYNPLVCFPPTFWLLLSLITDLDEI